MSATRDSGERSHSISRSVSGLPTLACMNASCGFQYSGTDVSRVSRLDGPTMSTAHRKVSGVKVAPTRAA